MMRFAGCLLLLLLLPCLPLSDAVTAQDSWDDEEFVFLPVGIQATYQSLDGQVVLKRMEPSPRLFGGNETTVHPKVPAEGFKVTWKGRLQVIYDAEYTFTLSQSSLENLQFTLDGRPVVYGQPMELLFGNLELEISGIHRGVDPRFELVWENDIFSAEIVHPRHFCHSDEQLESEANARQSLEDSGAALAESFGCFRCHRGPEAWVRSIVAERDVLDLLPGPQLLGADRRTHRDWLERFLRDPAANRPGTHMPAQFGVGPEEEIARRTIVAYLTGNQTAEIAESVAEGAEQQGRELYDAIGCAACHEPPPGTLRLEGVPLRIPSLDQLAEKWTAGGLTDFLASPLDTRLHARMPDFALSDPEAGHLAAYLLTRDMAGTPPEFVAIPVPLEPGADGLVDPRRRVLRMRLDSAADPVSDDSGRQNHGRVVGQIKQVGGINEGAIEFRGEQSHILVDDTEDIRTVSDFTWAVWFKTTGSGAIISHTLPDSKWVRDGRTLFVRGGKLVFDVGWVGALVAEKRIDDGTWHHAALTVEANADGKNDRVTLYVDGRREAVRDDWNITGTKDEVPGEGFVLMLGKAGSDFPQEGSFDGALDDATMWTRALESDEIAALAENNQSLAAVEAALFTTEELRSQWTALGEEPAHFDSLRQGARLQAIALRQMASHGCVNCHDAGRSWALPVNRTHNGSPTYNTVQPPATVPALTGLANHRLNQGCLAEIPAGNTAPRFDFTAEERNALAAYVASLALRNTPSMPEVVSLEMDLLNCTACHDNDGRGGEPLATLLGGLEEAKFFLPPELNGAGARLLPERLDEYLSQGTRNHRLRPWLKARMPGFGPRGSQLAVALCQRDFVDGPVKEKKKENQEYVPSIAVPDNQVQMGRVLVSNKGLTCVNCHAINDQQPSGEEDPSTKSPDLALVTDHIRRDYFTRLLRDPGRIFPETKMPVIFPKHGPAAVPALQDLPKDVLEQALWSYLTLGTEAPSPLEEEPMELMSDMLQVYVQRGPTFVGETLFGRGINCGFPGGTLMFDADRLEPGAVWFEGFLTRLPTNYFGLNWRAPESHEILSGQSHALRLRAGEQSPWQMSPLPLECDPNTESRFDGYTVGQSDMTFRYRLSFGASRIPVSDRVWIDRRDAWHGFVRELTATALPESTQLAFTLPGIQEYTLHSPNGAMVDKASGPEGAPLVVYRSDSGLHAIRVEAPVGSRWVFDRSTEMLLLVTPSTSTDASMQFRIDRWTFAGDSDEPTAEDLASLSAPELLNPKPLADKQDPQHLPTWAAAKVAPEEPFTYKIENIPGPEEGWRPSGTVFTADGTLYGCGLTEGRVYRAKTPPVPVPEKFHWQLYASGLNVPTGMNVVDDRLYISHRPEVTELIDANQDGRADVFRTVMGPWSLKDGFHEYAFGLAVDWEKRFYIALNNGYFWSYGGPTNRGRHRSDALRCDVDGNYEQWGHGLRAPNGICRGPDGQIFTCDNQGDWVQVCKIIHCREGVFYGHPEDEDDFIPEDEAPSGLPAVWIPYTVIRSAAALRMDETGGKFGPFEGQIFVGDTGYGQSVNIMRVALEKVNGVYQGAAMRFIDGPPRGPQHSTFGPDGHLYISCLTDGLVRVRYGGLVPMEIHRVNMRRDGQGFTLHFTKPIAPDAQVTPRTIRARRWYYPYSIKYGSPRYDEVDVPIREVHVSADRTSIDVILPIKTYKNCMVYYFNVGKLQSDDGQRVDHPEAWYTVQRVWE